MNSNDVSLNKEIDTIKLDFSLSPLHSWIRFFEYFVRLEVQKWQSSGKKKLVAQKMGLQSDLKKNRFDR